MDGEVIVRYSLTDLQFLDCSTETHKGPTAGYSGHSLQRGFTILTIYQSNSTGNTKVILRIYRTSGFGYSGVLGVSQSDPSCGLYAVDVILVTDIYRILYIRSSRSIRSIRQFLKYQYMLLCCIHTYFTGDQLRPFDSLMVYAEAHVLGVRIWVREQDLALAYLIDPDLVRRRLLDLIV